MLRPKRTFRGAARCMNSISGDTGGEFTSSAATGHPDGRQKAKTVVTVSPPASAAREQTANPEFATGVSGFRVHTPGCCVWAHGDESSQILIQRPPGKALAIGCPRVDDLNGFPHVPARRGSPLTDCQITRRFPGTPTISAAHHHQRRRVRIWRGLSPWSHWRWKAPRPLQRAAAECSKRSPRRPPRQPPAGRQSDC